MDYDLVVIGSGPGGYVAAIRAAQLGLKTACVEKESSLGGTCLNVGCIPSKSLLHSTELLSTITHTAEENGIEVATPKVNFAKMMERKNGVVSGFNQGISGLFKKNKIEHLTGHAKFVDPHTLDVGGKKVTAQNFIIATGSQPSPLPFLPFDEKKVLSSTGALALERIPKSMIVIGAGVIGVELGSVYNRLGTKVQVVEFLDRVCPPLDSAVSKAFEKVLKKQGMEFHLSTKVESAKVDQNVILSTSNGTLEAEVVLVSIGRRPYTENLGLETLGIETEKPGFIPINGAFQTKHPHIFAIGDVAGPPMLAHKASEEGIAAVELIAGLRPHIEYLAIPNVVYTHPEVAAVGFTTEELKAKNIPIKAGQFAFKANSRARCISDDEGFVKLLCHATHGTLLGAHIIGPHAGELIQECALAIEKKLTAHDIAYTSHAHPTLTEAIKEAALAVIAKPIHL
ncbi:MAG: dihydrolipoyl dehydrogenase [Simkaniaceae bacterium]|nr:dihydrolipoyl dehydrogenase [Simkaniaceae bacterium]